MLLFELLDSPLPWTVIEKEDNQVTYEFTLPDGGRTIHVIYVADPYSAGKWVVVFNDATVDNRTPEYSINNKGGELAVFSTVLDTMKDFLTKNERVFKLVFEASESNRQKLYARMLKRYIQPPWHFKVGEFEDDASDIGKEVVAEAKAAAPVVEPTPVASEPVAKTATADVSDAPADAPETVEGNAPESDMGSDYKDLPF